jgi:DNA-binding transcriptional regulator GbsR (MarR family)
MKPNEAQSEFVERVGRWWETVGTRSAGRVLGWLMICDPPHRSAAGLADELHLSAGSVSTQTSTLERIGFVERITFPGDRASYYQLKPNVWFDLMMTERARLQEMRDLASAAFDLVPGERPDRVTDLDRVAEFFMNEWPGLMKRLSEQLQKEKAK